MARLSDSLTLRSLTLRNRIAVSPMCQYSSTDGFSTDWHLVHLGAFATGGAGLVMTEAAAVQDIGRITPADLGLWKDEHIAGLQRVAAFIRAQGAVPAIQLAHAGRKASHLQPWLGGAALDASNGAWQTVSASPIPFDHDPAPRALTVDEIHATTDAFVKAAVRSREAGFQVVELHFAHGYLVHQFLSPLSNQRTDGYGGSEENRHRFALDIVKAVRAVWQLPLFVRVSASDYTDGGLTIDDTVRFAKKLREAGVDLVDCSSGGLVKASISAAPGYQVPFAEAVRRDAEMASAAVGLITEATQADDIVSSGKADLVMVGREMLRDPHWAIRALTSLGGQAPVPNQYLRAY